MSRHTTREFGALFDFIRNGMNVRQSKEPDGLPITRIETISSGSFDLSRVGYAGLKENDAKEWILKSGDILFSHINSVDHIGKCAIFRGTDKPVIHGMNLLCLRPNLSETCPDYAKWYIKSAEFRRKLLPFVNKAVNQASVSIKNLAAISVPLPPLAEQKRIAAILDQADALRRLRQRAIARLDTLGQAIFHEMFGKVPAPPVNVRRDNPDPPPGWHWQMLGSVAQLATGHTPDRKVDDYWNGDIPWMSLTDIRTLDGRVADATSYSVTNAGIAKSAAVILPRHTVCFSRTASVGFVTIMGREMATSQDFVNWTCRERLDPFYLGSISVNC